MYKSSDQYRKAICVIADNLRWRNIQTDRARQLYSIAAGGLEYPEMIWARMGLAISCIRSKDYSTAGRLVAAIIDQYSQDSRIGSAICQIADQYRDKGRHTEAIGLYQQVIDRYPQDPYALWSQMGVAVSCIATGDQKGAEDAIEKLGRYRSDADYAHALCIVADNYRWRDKHDKAIGLYRQAVEAGGDHRYGIWFITGLGISAVMTGDVATADAALEALINRYQQDKDQVQCIYELGYAYSNAGLHERAGQILAELASQFPGNRYGILARGALGLVRLRQSDQAGSQQIYSRLIEDNPDSTAVAQALWLLGHEYYDQAMAKEKEGLQQDARALFAKAIDVWGIIRDRYGQSSYAADAWYFSGVLYRRHLGDYQKAGEFYQQLADRRPDYQYAWSAVGMLPTCYRRLMDAGLIDRQQADRLTQQAYEVLVDRYPDSPMAPDALVSLARIYSSKGQIDQAMACYQRYLADYTSEGQLQLCIVGAGDAV